MRVTGNGYEVDGFRIYWLLQISRGNRLHRLCSKPDEQVFLRALLRMLAARDR